MTPLWSVFPPTKGWKTSCDGITHHSDETSGAISSSYEGVMKNAAILASLPAPSAQCCSTEEEASLYLAAPTDYSSIIHPKPILVPCISTISLNVDAQRLRAHDSGDEATRSPRFKEQGVTSPALWPDEPLYPSLRATRLHHTRRTKLSPR